MANTSLQHVLVTGATDGIGLVTARELARQGYHVIGVGRNPQKIAAAQARIVDQLNAGDGAIEFLQANLSLMHAVRDLAAAYRARYARLDILINNAGALFKTYGETAEGIERTFALNHLVYFLLTYELLDMLKAQSAARVVVVSSGAHYSAPLDFDDLYHKANYGSGWPAYRASKTANILFTNELARRLDGTDVTANSLDPGFVQTNFFNAAGLTMRGQLTPEQGAATTLHVATAPELAAVSGRYFTDSREVDPAPHAQDPEAARRLWAISEQLCGLA